MAETFDAQAYKRASISRKTDMLTAIAEAGMFDQYTTAPYGGHDKERHDLSAAALFNRLIDDIYIDDKLVDKTVSTFLSPQARKQAMSACVMEHAQEIAAWSHFQTRQELTIDTKIPQTGSSNKIVAWSLRYDQNHGQIIAQENTNMRMVLREIPDNKPSALGFYRATFYTYPSPDNRQLRLDMSSWLSQTDLMRGNKRWLPSPVENRYLQLAIDNKTPHPKMSFNQFDDELTIGFNRDASFKIASKRNTIIYSVSDENDTRNLSEYEAQGWARQQELKYPAEAGYILAFIGDSPEKSPIKSVSSDFDDQKKNDSPTF